MKQKTYETKKQKTNKIILHMEPTPMWKLPNPLHAEAQRKYRSNVYQDRRYKAPRYKKSLFEAF